MDRRRGGRRWREPRKGGRHFLGVDVGVVSDYTAFALLRRVAPNVLLPIGRDPDAVAWDVDADAPLELPDGVTLAQHLLPVYEVIDLQRTRGTTFEVIAREAELTAKEVGGCTVAVDATGMGRGVVEEMRRIGMRPIAVTLGGGRRIAGGRHNWTVPSAMTYESVYGCFAQNRYKIAEALSHTSTLLGELARCEVRRTETGHARYGVFTGEDGHGDLLMALGIATVVAERMAARPTRRQGTVEATSLSGAGDGDQRRRRRQGTPRGGAARRRIEELREERERLWRETAGLSAPIGWPGDD